MTTGRINQVTSIDEQKCVNKSPCFHVSTHTNNGNSIVVDNVQHKHRISFSSVRRETNSKPSTDADISSPLPCPTIIFLEVTLTEQMDNVTDFVRLKLASSMQTSSHSTVENKFSGAKRTMYCSWVKISLTHRVEIHTSSKCRLT